MTDANGEALGCIIKSRRSVRRGYTKRPVPEDVLRAILEAGVAAPSGSNAQRVRFYAETDRAEIARLGSLRYMPAVGGEPESLLSQAAALVFVFTTPVEGRWHSLAAQDTAAAIQNMLLMATAFGVASCWVSAYTWMSRTPYLSGKAWHEVLPWLAEQFDAGLEPFGSVVLGYSTCMEGDVTHRGRAVVRQPLEAYLLRRPL